MAHRPWTEPESIIAFEFYCRTPFGRLDERNPEVVALAAAIGRTRGAVAMRCTNFASLDPAHAVRGVRGLKNASTLDGVVFEKYARDLDALDAAARAAAAELGVPERMIGVEAAEEPGERPGRRPRRAPAIDPDGAGFIAPRGPTEAERTVKVRRVQAFFRRAVVAAYDEACAACALAVPAMLVGSHIVPWRSDESRRADPRNGICFCALHDRAFDGGFFTLRDDLTIVVSARLRVREPCAMHRAAFLAIDGAPLRAPHRFAPDPTALEHHRTRVFVA